MKPLQLLLVSQQYGEYEMEQTPLESNLFQRGKYLFILMFNPPTESTH